MIYTISLCVFIAFIKPFLLIGGKNSPIQLLSIVPSLIVLLLYIYNVSKFNFFTTIYCYSGLTILISLIMLILVPRIFKPTNVLIN